MITQCLFHWAKPAVVCIYVHIHIWRRCTLSITYMCVLVCLLRCDHHKVCTHAVSSSTRLVRFSTEMVRNAENTFSSSYQLRHSTPLSFQHGALYLNVVLFFGFESHTCWRPFPAILLGIFLFLIWGRLTSVIFGLTSHIKW